MSWVTLGPLRRSAPASASWSVRSNRYGHVSWLLHVMESIYIRGLQQVHHKLPVSPSLPMSSSPNNSEKALFFTCSTANCHKQISLVLDKSRSRLLSNQIHIDIQPPLVSHNWLKAKRNTISDNSFPAILPLLCLWGVGFCSQLGIIITVFWVDRMTFPQENRIWEHTKTAYLKARKKCTCILWNVS